MYKTNKEVNGEEQVDKNKKYQNMPRFASLLLWYNTDQKQLRQEGNYFMLVFPGLNLSHKNSVQEGTWRQGLR